MVTIAQEWIQEGVEEGKRESARHIRDGILYTPRFRFRLSNSESALVALRLAQLTDPQVLAGVQREALTAFASPDFLRRLESIAS